MASPRIAAAAEIRAHAEALGFDAFGIASAEPGPRDAERLRAFLAAGHHGTMEWLANREAERASPRALWPDARSVICVGLAYTPACDPLENLDKRDRGTISVYARGRDYHALLKGKLKHLAQHVVARHGGAVKVFVDTAPVLEKPAAERAGIGWQGKHTNLVSRSHGSWLLLGEVFSTLDLPADAPHGDRCGTCRRCLDACPTDAFPAPYRLDATRCIAYLTLEHAGPIPEALRPAMGNRIAGCDDCLAVCPWNRFAQASRHIAFAEREALASPPLSELAMLDDAGFRALFSASPVKRIGRNRFARNVAIAIGNSGEKALLPAAAHLAADSDPVVAEAGAWALGRLA
jgi:epoxyqueuosine reductase